MVATWWKRAVAFSVVGALADKCDVSGSERSDCGFVGITKNSCEAKNCCWRPANNGVPWCFHPSTGPGPAPGPTPGPAPPSQCSLKHTLTGAPFTNDELTKIRGFFMANIDIQGSGAVVAAPDHNTGPGGDYYFHWERDGALSMDALMRTAGSLAEIDEKMQHYVAWVTKTQNQADPHGIDVRTEPKYTIPDGKPFGGGWCRPQNDGPGLRGRTLSEYALALLSEGRSDYVKDHLWTGDSGKLHGGLVKYDLDWVADNWQSNGCDLWEELSSNNFFWNRYVDRASLDAGARLADKVGDSATAAKYRSAKAAIEKTLSEHFDGTFVFEASNRKKDSAVIEAFNVGDLGDGLFAPLSKEVLGTVITLNDLFCKTFDINRADSAAGIPGILYGRYEGDHYNGGNPWVLLTATLGQLVYRQALDVIKGATISSENYALLQKAYDIDAGLSGKVLADALVGVADGVILRIKHHVQTTGLHMAEQIGRTDGKMTSAKDLTWNYADVLKAMHARKEYVLASGGVEQTAMLMV